MVDLPKPNRQRVRPGLFRDRMRRARHDHLPSTGAHWRAFAPDVLHDGDANVEAAGIRKSLRRNGNEVAKVPLDVVVHPSSETYSQYTHRSIPSSGARAVNAHHATSLALHPHRNPGARFNGQQSQRTRSQPAKPADSKPADCEASGLVKPADCEPADNEPSDNEPAERGVRARGSGEVRIRRSRPARSAWPWSADDEVVPSTVWFALIGAANPSRGRRWLPKSRAKKRRRVRAGSPEPGRSWSMSALAVAGARCVLGSVLWYVRTNMTKPSNSASLSFARAHGGRTVN